LWSAVETALRNVSYVGKAREIKVASLGNGTTVPWPDRD
jgi:hypothetical protein